VVEGSERVEICIHRGSDQIGGSCVELRSQGKRLLLDVGLPLDAENGDHATLPGTLDLESTDSLAGIAISHPHADHYGLANRLSSEIPVLMGPAAERILRAAAELTPSGGAFETVVHFSDREPVVLGPFLITPYLMDHSAYDSYALHIESNGEGVFYTGDLRAHGRKGSLFERLLREPPSPVNVLLMEGSTLSRVETNTGFPSESDLESRFVELFRSTRGLPLVWCSGQNIDRIVTIFRACKRAGRQLILDMYAAHILAATKNQNLPQACWDEIRVFLPRSQKMRIIRDQSFEITERYKADRIYSEQLVSAAGRSVMLFRPGMRQELEDAACLADASLIYSMWDGYLRDDNMQPFQEWLKKQKMTMHKCHTSGHASVRDLKRLREAFGEAVVVPIHTQQPELYEETFGNVGMHRDGEWWHVSKGQ
jgi:ribonuclease J